MLDGKVRKRRNAVVVVVLAHTLTLPKPQYIKVRDGSCKGKARSFSPESRTQRQGHMMLLAPMRNITVTLEVGNKCCYTARDMLGMRRRQTIQMRAVTRAKSTTSGLPYNRPACRFAWCLFLLPPLRGIYAQRTVSCQPLSHRCIPL